MPVNAPDAPLRLLIVDDHPMVREGLRSMLAGQTIELVGEAGTGGEAVQAVQELGPDLVLLDVELPDLDGVAVLQRIKEVAPRSAVLVVSMHDDPRVVRRMVEAGAAGYVLKGASRRELLAAVQAVRDGESVLAPSLLRALVTDARPGAGPAASARPPALADPLTPLEHDVLRLVADGLTNREIGERMRWSVATAKKYVQRILEKLDVSDRTQAAVAAVRRGLVS
jgi:DNA-binding NarL/FixJ family response regulator